MENDAFGANEGLMVKKIADAWLMSVQLQGLISAAEIIVSEVIAENQLRQVGAAISCLSAAEEQAARLSKFLDGLEVAAKKSDCLASARD